jgi:DNA-binding MarR family transcriptional regulator/GNAT superfamily N-acetyltransferase
MNPSQAYEAVQKVRKFNRFYTERIGLLNQGYLETNLSLTHVRVLFELANRNDLTASNLIQELHIDPGYLSRILSRFAKEDYIKKSKSKSDNRFQHLRLTTKGRKAFSVLNERSSREIGDLLKNLSREDLQRLLDAMDTFETVLTNEVDSREPYLLRTHGPGDAGWIISRHGAIYAEEYNFDETFEGLVAKILSEFLQNHDPKRERLWIAERSGERIGSVLIVDAGENVAQLRILLVEPKARGMGIGKRLIQECIDFCKLCGYKKIKLWTQSILKEARHLYEKAGFKIFETKRQESFGHTITSEVWELPLKK